MALKVTRWLGILVCALTMYAQEIHLQVLCTSDGHGQIMPEDPYTLLPSPQGWAKLATLVRERKAANPLSILVDCGDELQGNPLSYIHHRLHPELNEPSMAILNALGYHAMILGNHEFDFGMNTLHAAEKQSQFPWLAANVVSASTGQPAFTPFIKLDMGGAQVLIVGLTTPVIPYRMEPERYEGLVFQDAVETAKTLIPKLREKEKPDVLIVALHGGLGKPQSCGLKEENPALCLAEKVTGIDLILTGHEHRTESIQHRGVPILQPSSHGRALGVADLTLIKESKKGWKLQACATRILQPTLETSPDPEVMELTGFLRTKTDSYLNTYATDLKVDLDGRWCRMESTPLMRLLHDTLKEATGAQVTAIQSPSARLFIPHGLTSVRQFWALFAYEDRPARIRINGAQLKRYLENSARFFRCSHETELFNRDISAWDYDLVEGCTFDLDLSKPVGRRIFDLRIQGQPLGDDQQLTLGITSGRAFGFGGYVEAIGFTGKPEFVHTESFRNLLLGRVLSKPSLDLVPSNNWHTIPSLDRERVLVQQP